MYFCQAHVLAISGAFKKLGALLLSSLLLTVFTAECGHLVDESVEHLLGHHQNSANASGSDLARRCHNCVTSQPQGETARWDYQPSSSLALFTVDFQVQSASIRPLLPLPAKRAPPST